MLPKNFPARRNKRRKEAEARKQYRNTLSSKEQIKILKTDRPGVSKKEIERLMSTETI